MKSFNKIMLLYGMVTVLFSACKKEDEEGELMMKFKTGSTYTSASSVVASGTDLTIGIEAETEKAKDPIIRFNISESVNGATATTVYAQELDTQEFEYDYHFTLEDTVHSNTHKFTFTVTNKDGINEQKSLTITVD